MRRGVPIARMKILFCSESGHGDIIVGLIEMRQEENIHQFQLINRDLFLDSQREHMNSH